MRKIVKILFAFVILFGIFIDVVYADEATNETKSVLTYDDLPDLSLKENDYEISCTYKDGATLVVSRDEVSLSNLSSSTSSSSSSNIGFYFAEGQRNSMENTTTTSYNHDNILEKGHCPAKLYVYRVEGKHLDDVDDENTTTENSTSGDDEDKEDNEAYFYSTKDDVSSDIAGTHKGGFLWLGTYDNAELMSDKTTYLISEQAFITTSKEYLVCDYETLVKDGGENSGDGSPLSIYMFKNLSFMELGGYITPLPDVLKGCPAADSEKKEIYVNDPTAKPVGGGNLLVASNKYNAIRFNHFNSSSDCVNGNNNQTCLLFEYKGSRNKDGKIDDNEISVCDVLGNELVDQIQGIATILQVVVPVIVIVLTAIDIGKIVVAGNIDEQLPKKKKVIIVRFFVMIIFFFLPLISRIIITLLNETGVVEIGNIDCIFK